MIVQGMRTGVRVRVVVMMKMLGVANVYIRDAVDGCRRVSVRTVCRGYHGRHFLVASSVVYDIPVKWGVLSLVTVASKLQAEPLEVETLVERSNVSFTSAPGISTWRPTRHTTGLFALLLSGSRYDRATLRTHARLSLLYI